MQALHPDSTGEDVEGQKGPSREKELQQSVSTEETQSKCCLRQLGVPQGAQSTPKGLSYLCLFKPKEKKLNTQAPE